MRHDVSEIRRRAKAVRHLVRIEANSPEVTSDEPSLLDTHPVLWSIVSTPVQIRTILSPLQRGIDTLGLLTRHDLLHNGDTPPSQAIHACFKSLRKAIKLLLKHAQDVRRIKYGKNLLRLFAKKPNMALKSILRTTAGNTNTNTLPTDLFIIKNVATGLLITNPTEVVKEIAELEALALSPNPTLPSGAPFPWIGYVRLTLIASVPRIPGQITPAIMQEALRRNPNHKAAEPQGRIGSHALS